jgi:competence protein ComEC
MTLAALAFAAGAVLLQQQSSVPAPAWLALLPLCGALLLLGKRAAVPAALAAGFLWAVGFAHLRLNDRLAPELEGRDIEVVGVVASLPAVHERSVRFEFEVESAASGARLPRRILLSWYRSAGEEELAAPLAAAVHPGERWLFTVRLRRPHGNVNPHGFDYEGWLLERGIGATGYVRQRGEQGLLGARYRPLDLVERARGAVRARVFETLGATPAAGVLTALAIGDQRAISNEEWRLFNRTAVTHLMSISGLHVTLVSGLFAWAAGALWRRSARLCLWVPARKAAALAAILAALGYTLLSGFAVPARRTFFMVAVVALALWAGRIASPARILALALLAVLLADPWAALAPGFWLSFGAVALIFYIATGWTVEEPKPAQWVRVQWAITVGLAPAVLLFFGQVSPAGPLANALAIPFVSVVITPLALLAAAVPVAALLELAAWLVEWLLQFLEWCAALPLAFWKHRVPPLWTILLALAGVAWVLAPRGVPWRATGLALGAPAFLLAPPVPERGEAWITTLDVGQGLAVLVRTRNHALLYDAGPAFGPHADSGGRIIVPALFAAGIGTLDMLVLSHEDSDHAGGARSVLEAMEVGMLASSLPREHMLNALARSRARCASGSEWHWDGVRFSFLHPSAEHYARRAPGNDLSCVLRVATTGGTMLLTGDISEAVERELARRTPDALRADVLLAPHHGSRGSSGAELLGAAMPKWAVVSAGYRNRFGHPHRAVLERYASAGAAVARTDRQGAVSVRLGREELELTTERAARGRYWHAMPRI